MSVSNQKAWTRDELILAINLYCKTPFGRIHMRNPEIIELSDKLGRTPGSVSYKLANFASIDPTIDRKGAVNVSKLDREVWNDFFNDWEKMILESETRMAQLKKIKSKFEGLDDFKVKKGDMKDAIVKVRINQEFFRKMILTSYSNSCCITGIDNTELLVASHIVPWVDDKENRVNPMNGLCLNALHDRAFDNGLISIDESYKVIISKKVKHKLILQYDRKPIKMPDRFLPDQKFLSYHRENIFLRN
jgi:putative restriction endonuclease